ncbi:MAG TPA: BTAD domain-containing putative transcriptional regulator [Actinocrinis sp.]|nr:BTAD domain-containing putative transcriptional regulator [Actinocrinis sp.]
MGSELRLLGDVALEVDGRRVDLGHPRQRSVFAAMAAEANSLVPVDGLVDRVWGEGCPPRAREALYSYVSRLRHTLAASTGDARLVRRSGGYLLAVDPSAVDVSLFSSLVADARATADDNDRAEALFERALGLWHGEPFAGLDTPWFNTLRASLCRERLEAELDRNDLALRRGRHGALVAELYDRTATFPLDERLTGQLMLALHANGRSADALQQYREMRRRLTAELGTEPGPALRLLHQRILVADPTLPGGPHASPPTSVASSASAQFPTPASALPPTPKPSPVPVPVPAPHQLPPSPRLFVGREPELEYLSEIVDREEQQDGGGALTVLIVGGAGGIGKTCLAVRWGHENAGRFPDGQLYLNLRGFDPSGPPIPPAAALRALLDALGVAPAAIPADQDARSGLFRGLVADRRMLVVLDNAHDSAQVAPLLPGRSACTVLVTSRNRLGALVTAHGARSLTLDALDREAARGLLAGHLGRDRVGSEPGAVGELLDWCSGLPLALSIAGARAAAQPALPLSELTEELREETTRLDALDAGELSANLRAVFACSYRALDPETANVFGLLGLAPGPDIGLRAAASLTGLPMAEARRLLRGLEHAHLLAQYKPGRYRMHDLIRLYAAERAAQDHAQDTHGAAVERLVDYYLHTACAGELLLRKQSEPIALSPCAKGCQPEQLADAGKALAWFAAEHANLLAAHRLAADAGLYRAAWQLPWALDTFRYRTGYRQDNITGWAAGLAAVDRLPDPDPHARILALRRLGRAHSMVGEHEEALSLLHRSLELAEQAGDRAGQAYTQIFLGWAWELRGDVEQALAHCESALVHFQALGDPSWEWIALNAVGWYCAQLSRYEEARAHCERALELSQASGDTSGAASILDSLGYIAYSTGDYAQALIHYQGTLDRYREFGNRYSEADTLVRLAEAHEKAESPQAAADALRQALELYRVQVRTADVEQVEQRLADLAAVHKYE